MDNNAPTGKSEVLYATLVIFALNGCSCYGGGRVCGRAFTHPNTYENADAGESGGSLSYAAGNSA